MTCGPRFEAHNSRKPLIRLLAMSFALAIGSSCANPSMQNVEVAFGELQRTVAEGQLDACMHAKARCLTVIDKATQHRKRELSALYAKLGADVKKENTPNAVIARSITVLEKELADLSIKEDKVKAIKCDNLNTD